MGDTELYQSLGRKIGALDEKVITKAAELKNMLNVRAGSVSVGALRLTDTACVVLCLDMAATLLSQPVDRVEAVKLSGLKKTRYHVALKSLESVLDLNTKTNMRDLAVRFGCLQSLNMASQLLSRYEREQCCDVDTNSILFQTAALLCTCKREKVPINKGKLRELSGVKRSTMDRLVAQMDKIADKLKDELKRKAPEDKATNTLMDDVEKAVKEPVLESPPAKKAKEEKDINYYKRVNFEAWKRKLLEHAASQMDQYKA